MEVNMRARESKRFFASIDGNYDKTKLQNQLKHLGLEYQDFTVGLDEVPEKFLMIWNTAYTWEQFEQIILSLNKSIKNGTVWLGKKVDENYQIDIWKIDSKGNSKHQETKTIDAVTLTIDASNVKFGEFQDNICAASSEGMAGYYTRRRLLDEVKSNFKGDEGNGV